MSDNLSKEILNAKEELDLFLKDILSKYDNIRNDKESIQTLVNELIGKHTKLLNTTSNSLGQEHQENDLHYNTDLQRDYLASIEGFINISFKTIDVIDIIVTKHKLSTYSINDKGYITLQKLINTFSKKENRNRIKNEFEKRNIGTSGFNQKFKRMKHKYLRLQLFIGIPLLIISILIIFLGEYFLGKSFNGIQLIILKALIALSFSIVGSSMLEGQVETNWTLTKGLTIRAVGWVAVFLLIYFLNPANPGEVY